VPKTRVASADGWIVCEVRASFPGRPIPASEARASIRMDPKVKDPVLQHTRAGLRVEDRGEERDHRGGGVCCEPILHCTRKARARGQETVCNCIELLCHTFSCGPIQLPHACQLPLACNAAGKELLGISCKLQLMPRRSSFPCLFLL
jgi:hypothetical protein